MSEAEQDPPSPTWSMNLHHTDPAVMVQLRRWAAQEMADLGDDHLTDVLLVAIELVTNAYDHGGGPRSIRMTRDVDPCVIQLDVEDSNRHQPTPGTSRFGSRSHRGRGLIIVGKLAESWGVVPHAETGGKTVWARIACHTVPCVR